MPTLNQLSLNELFLVLCNYKYPSKLADATFLTCQYQIMQKSCKRLKLYSYIKFNKFTYEICKFESFISNNELKVLLRFSSLDENHPQTHSTESQITQRVAGKIQQLQKPEKH